MDDRPTYTERAFTLAGNGQCESMKHIREQLKAEGYTDVGQLHGGSIRKQLIAMIAAGKIRD